MPLKFNTLDLFGDKFTYRMRISLGEALQTATDDYTAMCKVFDIVYDIELKPCDVEETFDEYMRVLSELQKWAKLEGELKYRPTREEVQAGADHIFKNLGYFSTVDAVALRMHISHNSVLDLSYMTVYLMLKKDMLQAQYEKKLNKILNDNRGHNK